MSASCRGRDREERLVMPTYWRSLQDALKFNQQADPGLAEHNISWILPPTDGSQPLAGCSAQGAAGGCPTSSSLYCQGFGETRQEQDKQDPVSTMQNTDRAVKICTHQIYPEEMYPGYTSSNR